MLNLTGVNGPKRPLFMLTLSYLKITAPFKDYPRGLWIFPDLSGISRFLAWDPHGANGYFFLTWRQKKLQ